MTREGTFSRARYTAKSTSLGSTSGYDEDGKSKGRSCSSLNAFLIFICIGLLLSLTLRGTSPDYKVSYLRGDENEGDSDGSIAGKNDKYFLAGEGDEEKQRQDMHVGEEGGAWTAATHLSVYGFNVDPGLVLLLQQACRDIEDVKNPDDKWKQHPPDHPNVPNLFIEPKNPK